MSQVIQRLPEWRSNLCVYLDEVARECFEPGVHDCALFAAGAVRAMTGVDLASGYVGQYRTISEGMGLLRREGVVDLAGLVARHFVEIPPLMAAVGDIAIVDGEGGREALGVVQGPSVFALGREGVGRVPLERATRGFRV